MIPGHTKFGPDGHFGNAKYKFYQSNVETFGDIVSVI